MNINADVVIAVICTLGVVGVVWLAWWLFTRVRWALEAVSDLNERVVELEKTKRPAL